MHAWVSGCTKLVGGLVGEWLTCS